MPDQILHLRTVFQQRAQNTLFIDSEGGRHQTYGDVLAVAENLSQHLGGHGVKPGDTVCILADNSLEMLNLFFGIWQAGGVAVPLNPQLAVDHIVDILDSFSSYVMLVDQRLLDLADKIKQTLMSSENQKQVTFYSDQHSDCDLSGGAIDISNIVKQVESGDSGESEAVVLFDKLDGDAACMIIFTSGSTSAPKGVQISMNRLVHNERVFCAAMGLQQDNRFVHMFPMSYLAGTHNLLLLPISVGASIVITPPLGGRTLFSFWDKVKEHEINTLWFTATMLSMLLKVDDGADMSWLKQQMRCALVGMAPLPQATKIAFEERFHMHLHENFALSETAFISTSVPGKTITPGSKGFILEGVTVQTRDLNDCDKRLADTEEGELFVQSPSLMLNYYQAKEGDSNNLVVDGFFTGDIGYVEGDELYVTGRQKDLLIRGGINISPVLVESAISSLQEVLEVAVVGVEHSDYGEEVAAAIVLAPGCEDLTLKQIQTQLKGKLAYFQQPKTIKIMAQMPKGLTGKIDKKAVKLFFSA